MKRFIVERVDPNDAHRRKIWEFDFNQANGIRLTRHSIQTRQSNRHKWKGEFWDSMDERQYHSYLPRPTTIPEDVVSEAFDIFIEEMRNVPVYIGRFNHNHILQRGAKK